MLFNLLKDEDDETQFKKRKHAAVGESKEVKCLNDIFQYLQEKGTKKWPQFVALELSKLPPITLDRTDFSVLLSKMQKLQSDVDMMRRSIEAQYEISDSLKTSNKKLQERVEQIEIKSYDDSADVRVNKDVLDISVTEESFTEETEPFSCSQCDFKCDELAVLEG